MTVVSYDYSEPQYGKDICNRIICPMKAVLKKLCNEGNDILTAEDMRNALLQRQVKGATATACLIDDSNTTLNIKKIKLFTIGSITLVLKLKAYVCGKLTTLALENLSHTKACTLSIKKQLC
jgi:hypothetical protein